MNKNKLNYIIDLVLIMLLIVVSITGLIIFFFLPGGVKQGRYQEFMGITKATWSSIHNYSGIVMIFFMIFHLVLHFNWLKSMTRNFSKIK